MMAEVKATKRSKIQSIILLQDFPKEFIKSPNNELYCNLCSYTVYSIKPFLVESHQNPLKDQKA